MTLVDLIVWTSSLASPLLQDLILPNSYGVANCSPRFCRKTRHFDLGESRCLTPVVQTVSSQLHINFVHMWYILSGAAPDICKGDVGGNGNGGDDGNDTKSTESSRLANNVEAFTNFKLLIGQCFQKQQVLNQPNDSCGNATAADLWLGSAVLQRTHMLGSK